MNYQDQSIYTGTFYLISKKRLFERGPFFLQYLMAPTTEHPLLIVVLGFSVVGPADKRNLLRHRLVYIYMLCVRLGFL